MKPNNQSYDVIIIGAGAAGLMCAIEAGKRGRKVLLLDHAKNVGEKIRISGGGRCNFTNIYASPKQYLSQNLHFCVSALKRYTPQQFISLVEKHDIAYHEKTLGQLFCDGSSKQIISMLLEECQQANVEIRLGAQVHRVEKAENFCIHSDTIIESHSLVIATGGLSIPKMGATGFGYQIAKQFGLPLIDTQAGLVPFTLSEELLARYSAISGASIPDIMASSDRSTFREAMLFTHRGLSGPAILQISSYWQQGKPVTLNLSPEVDLFNYLKTQKTSHPKQEIATALANLFPKRLVQLLEEEMDIAGHKLADTSNKKLQEIGARLNAWHIIPSGTEGYRTAEVTLGGVDTNVLSSQTMEAKKVSGLYFIGEVVDVTGWLGGYNFQWAWASGHAAGQYC